MRSSSSCAPATSPLVGAGELDLGITGRDMLIDSRAAATAMLELGFGSSTFRLAAPVGDASTLADFDGMRIATAYPGVLKDELDRLDISATIVGLDGAVENAVALGVADAVADVVDTGTTLRKAGLVTVGDPLPGEPGNPRSPHQYQAQRRRHSSVAPGRDRCSLVRHGRLRHPN